MAKPNHSATKLQLNLTCPISPSQITGFMLCQGAFSSCQHTFSTELELWGLFVYVPLPPESLGSIPHADTGSSITSPTALGPASSSSGVSHVMHLPCICRAFVNQKVFGVLVPSGFSLGTLLPKLIRLQDVRERMLVVIGKMVVSYNFKQNKP